MDVINLRTLTEKSKLGFGKYSNLAIEEIINLGKKTYLIWIYFSIEGISFNESVLDKLNIFKNFRIKKPGKDLEKCNALIDIKYRPQRYDVETYLKMRAKNKRRNKSKLVNFDIVTRKQFTSRRKLQRKNQGHK